MIVCCRFLLNNKLCEIALSTKKTVENHYKYIDYIYAIPRPINI